MVSANALCAATGLSAATVNKTLVHLQSLGLVDKTSARLRGRIFAYRDYVALLNAGSWCSLNVCLLHVAHQLE